MPQNTKVLVTSLFKVTVNFHSSLFLTCLLYLTPLIIPFFCHVSTFLLAFVAPFASGSTPTFAAAPKPSLSMALNPFQLSSSSVSIKDLSDHFHLYIQPFPVTLTHHSFSDDYQLYASAHLSELHEIILS